MKTTLIAGLVLGLSSGAALAEMQFDISPTLDCLAQQGDEGDRMSCVGVAAGVCMDGNETTVGMGFCLEQEWMYWDDQLNAVYKEAKAGAAAMDKDMAPPLNVQEQSLKEMQRAWIAFRDARCNWEAALWMGGTGSGPAQLACLMQETGRQALTLQILGLGQ